MNTFLFFSTLIAFSRASTIAVAPGAVAAAAPIAAHQPAPIVKTHHVAQPIFQDVPVHAQVPVTGPVRTHQTVHQPIVHETRTHSVQAVTNVAAAPVATVHAAPVAAVNAAPVAAVHAAPVAGVHAAGYAANLGYNTLAAGHLGLAAAPLAAVH